jgi:hypothetical protein
MKISKRKVNALVRGAIAAMPAIPYIMKSRRRRSVAAYVLSTLGIAVVGGLAALMVMSPRTRHRAMDAAKGTYGKMNEKISRLRPALRHSHTEEAPVSDGLSGRRDYGTTTDL